MYLLGKLPGAGTIFLQMMLRRKSGREGRSKRNNLIPAL